MKSPRSRYLPLGIISAIAAMAAIFMMEYFWAGNHNLIDAARKSTSGLLIGLVIGFVQYSKIRRLGKEE